MDSAANLTVEAGNFCPPTQMYADSLKAATMIDFYQRLSYDAVALGTRELGYSFGMWKDAVQHGLPVLAANIFHDAKARDPWFELKQANHRKDNGQFCIRKDHRARMGVIGFVSSTAWKARKDTLTPATFKSPFEMAELVQKVAKKCDHLTVIGDFTMQEAESLLKVMPQINLVVGSNIRIDQSQIKGKSVIVGMPPRGNNGNYLEWDLAVHDSAAVFTRTVSLDTGAPEDSTIAKILADVKVKSTGPAPVPGKPATITAAAASPAPSPTVKAPPTPPTQTQVQPQQKPQLPPQQKPQPKPEPKPQPQTPPPPPPQVPADDGSKQ